MRGFKLRYIAIVLVAGVLAAAWFWGLLGLEGGFSKRPEFKRSTVEILSPMGNRVNFEVELAVSMQEQKYGLMFIDSLKNNKGMLFTYREPREAIFWMKNTQIPLDMLFIRPDGKICRIVSEAKPLDITPITSQEPVIAVLEIGGGEAKRQGINVGDMVLSSEIKPVSEH